LGIHLIFSIVVGIAIGLAFMNLPPVLDRMMGLYGVTHGGMAILLSALLWSHAAMQIPGGILSDRMGLTRTLLWSLALLAGGNLIAALWLDLHLAIAGRVVAGLGTGLGFITVLKMLAIKAPPGKTGAWQSYFGGMFSLGSILGYLVFPSLFDLSWRMCFVLPGLVALAGLAMVPFLHLSGQGAAPAKPLPLGKIAVMKICWVIGIFHALSYGSVVNLGNWVPSLLAEVQSAASSEAMGWGGALVLFISALARAFGGVILARTTATRLALGSISALAVLFTALALAGSVWLVLVLALVASFFGSITFGSFFEIVGKACPPQSLASVFGFVNMLANVGAVGFTLALGWSKDLTGTFAFGFAMMAGVTVLALVLGQRTIKAEAG